MYFRIHGFHRRLLAAALAASVVLLVTVGPVGASANTPASSFDTDAEGWTTGTISSTTLAPNPGSSPPSYSSSGGNPGGEISYPSTGSLSAFGSFVSPSTWMGDLSGNYGGVVRFDLYDSQDAGALNANARAFAEINNGTQQKLLTAPPPAPGPSWTTYSIPLTESFWCKDGSSCNPVTKAEFMQVLANTGGFERFWVVGQYSFDSGVTVMLDNVSVSADTTPPETNIDAGPSTSTNDPTPTFRFSSSGGYSTSWGSSDAYSSFACSVDQGAPNFVPCPHDPGTPATYTQSPPLGDGDYTFRVKATDLAGNTDSTPSMQAFTVDTHAPTVKITAHPKARTTTKRRKAMVRFAFEASEPSAYKCKLDKQAYRRCDSSKSYKVAAGKHKFSVMATDAATNSSSPASDSFKVVRGH